MDLAQLQEHFKTSILEATPTEDIISYGLLLLGEPLTVIEKILEHLKPPVEENISIDIDTLIAEYQKEISETENAPKFKKFSSLEEMCVGARGWRDATFKTKKLKSKGKESNDSDTELPGEFGRGVPERELVLFLTELGCTNPTRSAAFIKKFIHAIRKNFSVAARLEELDIKTCKPKELSSFLANFENERFLNYINFVLGNSEEAPWDSDSKRILGRYFGITGTGGKAKLKEVIKNPQDKSYHKLLVIFGKETCKDKEPICDKCPVNSACNYKTTLTK